MKYVLFFIPMVLLLLLYLPVRFEIKYVFSNGYYSLDISTSYLFGIFKPELYPYDKKDEDKNKKLNTIINLILIFNDPKYKELIEFIWDKITIRKINWNTKIGLTDASLVGIIYGLIWSFKNIIISFILANKEINSINLNVVPIFNKNQLDITFNCIIKIRIVYIINVWIWLLKKHIGGEKNDRTSHRRFNENYNE